MLILVSKPSTLSFGLKAGLVGRRTIGIHLLWAVIQRMVDLHTIVLNQDASKVGRFWLTLSDNEKERAARFRRVEHKKRFIIAHGAARQILSRYTGRLPKAIQFDKSPSGKPVLAHDVGWSFSLSYSMDVAVLAVSGEGETGVDIEWRQPDRPFLELARRFFFPSETEYLSGLSECERIGEFYRMWTLKESWLKAIGIGLAGLGGLELIPNERKLFDMRIHYKDMPMLNPNSTDDFNWSFFETLPGYTGCYTRLNSSQTVSTM